jgi:hypothetical protein
VSQCDPFYGSLCYIFGLIIYIFENNQYICATINKSMNISSELKNVNFTTPGTTPMYEMLLFFHHWREDFKNDNMLNAFMEFGQIKQGICRISRCLQEELPR